MHSERMLIFEPVDSKLRKASIGQYSGLMVTLKRRFNNVWVDADKQMQVRRVEGAWVCVPTCGCRVGCRCRCITHRASTEQRGCMHSPASRFNVWVDVDKQMQL